MRINQLRFLTALNKYKTFSRTSKELMVSQPPISAAIKELENELGFDILLRQNKGIEFTPLGQKVLEKSEIILQEMENISLLKKDLQNNIVGKLRIGTAPFFCSGIVLDVINALKKDYPGIQVQIQQNDSGTFLKLITLQEINLALVLIHDCYSSSFS